MFGTDTWVAVEAFGRRKAGFLRQFLDLPNGIPSYDSFGRVVAALDPVACEICFVAWVRETVRCHWAIENRLNWVRDLVFREDESRVRAGHAAEDLAVLRHVALNLPRRETMATVGVQTKRLMAGWDDAYLLTALGH